MPNIGIFLAMILCVPALGLHFHATELLGLLGQTPDMARAAGMQICGANGMGFYNLTDQLFTTFGYFDGYEPVWIPAATRNG